MSRKNKKRPRGEEDQNGIITVATIGGIGAVLVVFIVLVTNFKTLIEWSPQIKIIALVLALVVLALSHIFIRRCKYKSGFVALILGIFQPKTVLVGKAAPELSLKVVRLGSVSFVLLLASAHTVSVFFAPRPPIGSQSLYYVVVLDAAERMNTIFEGRTKWEAAQDTALDMLEDTNDHSNFGLVLIGGQSANRDGTDLCKLPSKAIIPITSDDGYVLDPGKLVKSNVTKNIDSQLPTSGGSFGEAFSLATFQMQDLPQGMIKVIIFISDSSDDCKEGGEDDEWDILLRKIKAAEDTGITVHSEIIVLDESYNPSVEEFAAKVRDMNQVDVQTVGIPNTNVEIAHTEEERQQIIIRVEQRIQIFLQQQLVAQVTSSPLPPTQMAGFFTEIATVYRHEATQDVARTPKLNTIVPVSSYTSTATLTPTETFTPTFTLTPSETFTPVTLTMTLVPTLTWTPVYIPPTEEPPTRVPPTRVPPTPIPPTPDVCNLSCSQNPDATAICNDCTYSFAENHTGACSNHDGVMKWCD